VRLRVLGAAAGGGFPQWNCACANCVGVRGGRLRASPRTQASLAISADGERWVLLGASPDVRVQLERTRELWPGADGRSPIAAVALPNGDVDAWAGLLSLREWTPLTLLATPPVRADVVDDNGVMATLRRFSDHSRWIDLAPDARVSVAGLTIEGVPAPGKPPLHRTREATPLDNVGFVVRDERRGRSVAWFPSVAGPTPAVERALREADAIFFDGTFFRDDELVRTGRSAARARQMGHWPVGGDDGSAAMLATLPTADKWLVHVNNTNPLVVDDSPERAWLRERGIDVAHDGLGWER
jgi:pyrroloquinoline quinone biosynthesis protein B